MKDFTGYVDLSAGEHTAYMQIYDYGGSTGGIIGGALVCPGGEAGTAACGAATIAGVPEPGTWTMMLFGFAGLGLAGHRWRKAIDAIV